MPADNLLDSLLTDSWHLQHVYIIDVSQSVEHDHPHAYDFLRSDLTNIAAFFKKCSSGSVRTLGLRKAFEFVTWGNVGEGLYGGEAEDEVAKRAWEDREWERCLGEWLEAGAGASQDKEDDDENSEGEVELVEEFKSTAIDASQDSAPLAKPPVASSSKPVGHANKSRRAPNYSVDLPDDTRDLDAAQDDLIFKSTYIPRSLAEVYDPERDVEAVNRGEGKDLEYIRTGGVGVVGVDDIEEEEEDDEEGSDDEDNDSDEEGEEGKDKKPKVLRGHRNEDRDAKKVSLSSPTLSCFCKIADSDSWCHCRNGKRRQRRRLLRSVRRRCRRRSRSARSTRASMTDRMTFP